MKPALILLVGLDSSLLGARKVILQSAGYSTMSAFSIEEAAHRFLSGDFNLVLLDSTLPIKDKDRLACLIRSSGSRTPIVSVKGQSSYEEPFAEAMALSLGVDPATLQSWEAEQHHPTAKNVELVSGSCRPVLHRPVELAPFCGKLVKESENIGMSYSVDLFVNQ
jgi:CheY-like chemotaxis protein